MWSYLQNCLYILFTLKAEITRHILMLRFAEVETLVSNALGDPFSNGKYLKRRTLVAHLTCSCQNLEPRHTSSFA